jgi:hypothetical protein
MPGAIDRLAEVILEGGEDAIVAYEPEGMAHQTVETPPVRRGVFAKLARVRDEHPVVSSANLGWGIEDPQPGPGGTFATLLHSEQTPALVLAHDTCARQGLRLRAAWPAFTVATACLKSRSVAPKTRLVIILTAEYTAISSCAGSKRSYRGWTGPMSVKDWKAFSVLIGHDPSPGGPAMAEGELRRGGILVVAEGNREQSCPFWEELETAGRIESVVGLDAFADGALRLPRTHPANLVEAFPRPLELNRPIALAGVFGLAAALTIGVMALRDRQRAAAQIAAERLSVENLGQNLKVLERNQREMARLRNDAVAGLDSQATGRHEALVGLAAALPQAVTLTSLVIGRDGAFTLEAAVAGKEFESASARLAMAHCGFGPVGEKGWVYDPSGGRLIVEGNCREARP